MLRSLAVVAVLAVASAFALDARQSPAGAGPYTGWAAYGGTPDQIRYSSLEQINRTNVSRLEVAWTHDTGETSGLQTQPIVVDGILYAVSPSHKPFALAADTGELLWSFDSGIFGRGPNRGVMYWADGDDRRVFAGVDQFVYALDARTGTPIETFGEGGRIDLRRGLGREPEQQSVRLTSPGVVFEDLLIIGGRVGETLPASPGDVRAFDVRTGELRWAFHTIPHPGEEGYETWAPDSWQVNGGANSWPGMALDESRGIVYVPTGSAAADFYGGNRTGDNLYANSLLALEAATGRRLWHFQFVHHDIWDRDLPSPPSLVTVERDGRAVDAVAQTTKQGYVFVFDRVTGDPLFPIEERAFMPSEVPGEVTAATQPLPVMPAPFARQRLTADMLTNRTPEAHAWAVEQFETFVSDGQFVPFSLEAQTVVFPGFDGGAEWGGAAFDPSTGLYYINSNDLAWTGGLAPAGTGRGRGAEQGRGAGEADDEPIVPYRFTGYRKFFDPDGYPAVEPPWGTLNAVNLNTGEYAWQIPLGEYPELAAQGLTDTGTENYGGPIVTAGGLVFIGATNYDKTFRAFHSATGELLWKATLPFGGNATPATYEVNGRQFVAVAAGGGKGRPPAGGVYVAFALPAP